MTIKHLKLINFITYDSLVELMPLEEISMLFSACIHPSIRAANRANDCYFYAERYFVLFLFFFKGNLALAVLLSCNGVR